MNATVSTAPCNICAKPESAINHRGAAARYGHYFEAMPNRLGACTETGAACTSIGHTGMCLEMREAAHPIVARRMARDLAQALAGVR